MTAGGTRRRRVRRASTVRRGTNVKGATEQGMGAGRGLDEVVRRQKRPNRRLPRLAWVFFVAQRLSRKTGGHRLVCGRITARSPAGLMLDAKRRYIGRFASHVREIALGAGSAMRRVVLRTQVLPFVRQPLSAQKDPSSSANRFIGSFLGARSPPTVATPSRPPDDLHPVLKTASRTQGKLDAAVIFLHAPSRLLGADRQPSRQDERHQSADE
jgi:hypothetical protein